MRRIGWIIAGTLAGFVLALQVPSLAQDPSNGAATPTQRTITVSGTATITAQPDEALVTLGVHTEAGNAQATLEQNAAKMSKVLDALHNAGLTADDLATTNVNQYPMYGSDGQDVTGYQADNQIQATIHDLAKVGNVIDAAVSAGANVASGVTFQLSDQNEGQGQALAHAIGNAKTKAEAMAGAAGAGIGEVVTINESSAATPTPYPMYAGAADGAASTPIQPPTIETQVSVSMTWTLV
jgi:uncharacterized protein YggE